MSSNYYFSSRHEILVEVCDHPVELLGVHAVLGPAVDLELSLGVAGVGAVLAAERLLARVGPDVADRVVPGRKLLEADGASPAVRKNVTFLQMTRKKNK